MDNDERTRMIKVKQSTYIKLNELVFKKKMIKYEQHKKRGNATYDGVINELLENKQ